MSPDQPRPREPQDEDAIFLERTFREQQAPLTRYAARLLGDADRARDVVQDTFMVIIIANVAKLLIVVKPIKYVVG